MRTAVAIVVPAFLMAMAPAVSPAQEMGAEQLTRMLNGPPARSQVQAPVNTPERPSPAPAAQARPAPEPAPAAAARAPAPAPAARRVEAEVSGPAPLSAQAISALPFRLDLNGAEIIERSAGPAAKVYSVRQGEAYLLMIYAGPQSQYPVYDGEQASVAGRVTTIVLQDGKRVAAEHLFRREDSSPADIHVWLMVTDGPQAALAERIGQSVDPR